MSYKYNNLNSDNISVVTDNDNSIRPNYLVGLLHQLNDVMYLANYNM